MAFAIAFESSRWPDGVVPFTISADFTDDQRRTVRRAIKHWNDRTIMRLVPRSNQADFVHFEPDPDSCQSSVGRIGGQQSVGCAIGDGFDTGSVIHEIGHAVGYFHEQQRPDRDQFVTVNTGNIESGKDGNFTIRSGTVLGPYDLGSIMHYPRNAFSTGGDTITPNNGESIGQRDGLSPRDIFGVCMMYGAPHIVTAFEDDGNRAGRSVVRWAGLARWGKYCWTPAAANSDADVHQSSPNVGMDSDRTSIVVWQEGRDGGTIRARCQTVDGAERFTTIAVTTGPGHSGPDVAVQPSGDFVVTWQSTVSGGQEIRARGFDRLGAARFDEILVSEGATGIPGAAAIGIDTSGNFVVAWGELFDEVLSVRARGFLADGTPRFATILVADDLGDQDVFPRVAVSADGSFSVAYERRMRDVRLRGFATDGSERFADMSVNVNPVGPQLFGDLAVTPGGRLVVVWTDDRNENTLGQLRMRAFNADGSEFKAESTANPRGGGTQLRPRIALDIDGNAYVAWEDDEDRNGVFQIHATGLRPNGTRLLRRVTVNTEWQGQQRRPAIASR